MPLTLPSRYHNVTLTIVRRYLNVTRRYFKKRMLDTSVPERPFTERPIASHYSVPGVQSCPLSFKTCLERSCVLIT
jgi:hypothetical protein